jgi:hypothetical protein
MDTRDEDQETGAPPAGPGLPLPGRAAAGLALLAAALLAAGALRFGWSATA